MTRLYKGLLAGKRATVTASIQRLEAGLAKLRTTQGDVDVLVEQARAIAVEVRLGGWRLGKLLLLAGGRKAFPLPPVGILVTTFERSTPYPLPGHCPAPSTGGCQVDKDQQVCGRGWGGEGEGEVRCWLGLLI